MPTKTNCLHATAGRGGARNRKVTKSSAISTWNERKIRLVQGPCGFGRVLGCQVWETPVEEEYERFNTPKQECVKIQLLPASPISNSISAGNSS